MPHTLLPPCRLTEKMGWGGSVVAGFCEWMTSVNLDPDIHACLQAVLEARDPSQYTIPGLCSFSSVMQAMSKQNQISCAHFIKGCISHQWQLKQDEYYYSIGFQCTAQSWTEGLVSNILSLIHKQWIAHNVVVHASDKKRSQGMQWQRTCGSYHHPVLHGCWGPLTLGPTPYHLWQTGSQRHVCYWPKQRLCWTLYSFLAWEI